MPFFSLVWFDGIVCDSLVCCDSLVAEFFFHLYFLNIIPKTKLLFAHFFFKIFIV